MGSWIPLASSILPVTWADDSTYGTPNPILDALDLLATVRLPSPERAFFTDAQILLPLMVGQIFFHDATQLTPRLGLASWTVDHPKSAIPWPAVRIAYSNLPTSIYLAP